MRAIRVDVTGTTDASGNFSQTIRLDKTDEWRVLKVAIGTTGPAEWVLTTSGTPLTYGRGRRVTLGPELLQPFDTLTVSCTGGPINAAISGSCTGMAGNESEVISVYTPAPNTIALDVAQPRRQLWPDGTALVNQKGPSFQVPAAVNTNATFTLPTGTTDVRIGSVLQGGGTGTFTTAIFLVGIQTGIRYFPKAGTGQPVGSRQPITIPVDVEYDTQVQVQVSPDGMHAMDVYVSALFGIEAVEVYVQEPMPVTFAQAGFQSTPALWQAPAMRVFNFQAGVGTIALLAGAAGQTIRIFSGVLDIFVAAAGAVVSLQDTTGDNLMQVRADIRSITPFNFSGEPLANGGAGLQMVVSGGAASATIGLGASQG